MKGVVLSIAPKARILDISHELTPFEIPEAAFVVAEAYRWFPKGTIHVVVIDPGVGTARRPILAQAGDYYFVAPDNGVLSMVYSREKRVKVRAVTAEKYFLKPVSHTFHGRDIFSPVAAHLAAGVPAARFGKVIADYLRLDFDKPVRTGKRTWTGNILKVDRFGNLITNFHIDEFPAVETRAFEIQAGLQKIDRIALTFAHGKPGELFVVVGSAGYLEVAANQASAAKILGLAAGSLVELTLG